MSFSTGRKIFIYNRGIFSVFFSVLKSHLITEWARLDLPPGVILEQKEKRRRPYWTPASMLRKERRCLRLLLIFCNHWNLSTRRRARIRDESLPKEKRRARVDAPPRNNFEKVNFKAHVIVSNRRRSSSLEVYPIDALLLFPVCVMVLVPPPAVLSASSSFDSMPEITHLRNTRSNVRRSPGGNSQ